MTLHHRNLCFLDITYLDCLGSHSFGQPGRVHNRLVTQFSSYRRFSRHTLVLRRGITVVAA
ncbi:MAG: hypothetical protein CYG59_03410 [Chloroflexi bacterium]|nr:MAG: hypothetical protein CYG59_03410 [Chloroflexota bacterium]